MDTSNNAISFLNNLTEEDIRQGNIQDRILAITQARRVVIKHHHLKMVEVKWNFMHKHVNDFDLLFNPLVKRGLPFYWEEKGPMLSQKEYCDRLINCIQDHRKFEDMAQQSLSGKTVVDKLSGEFELLFDFRVMCTKLLAPSVAAATISQNSKKIQDPPFAWINLILFFDLV